MLKYEAFIDSVIFYLHQEENHINIDIMTISEKQQDVIIVNHVCTKYFNQYSISNIENNEKEDGNI